MLAGVCAGLGVRLGIGVAVIRVVAVLTAPVSIWIYLALWGFTGSTAGRESIS